MEQRGFVLITTTKTCLICPAASTDLLLNSACDALDESFNFFEPQSLHLQNKGHTLLCNGSCKDTMIYNDPMSWICFKAIQEKRKGQDRDESMGMTK